jgi:hypothetical protein
MAPNCVRNNRATFPADETRPRFANVPHVVRNIVLSFVPRYAILIGTFGLALLLPSSGCGKKIAVQDSTKSEQIKELVDMLTSKQTDTGMGFDIRVGAAARLAEIGPAAQEFGAVPALEKLLKNKDPKVKEAAREALAKIKGS